MVSPKMETLQGANYLELQGNVSEALGRGQCVASMASSKVW